MKNQCQLSLLLRGLKMSNTLMFEWHCHQIDFFISISQKFVSEGQASQVNIGSSAWHQAITRTNAD